MAALDMSLVARSEVAVSHLMKRGNWASREPGVILVFAIVGAVAILLLCLFIQKKVRWTPAIYRASPANALPRWPSAGLLNFRYPKPEMESELVRRRVQQYGPDLNRSSGVRVRSNVELPERRPEHAKGALEGTAFSFPDNPVRRFYFFTTVCIAATCIPRLRN